MYNSKLKSKTNSNEKAQFLTLPNKLFKQIQKLCCKTVCNLMKISLKKADIRAVFLSEKGMQPRNI